MTIYTDGGDKVKTRTHVEIEKQKVNNKTNVVYDLLSRGGFTLIINEL